jgi:hypothetical protein
MTGCMVERESADPAFINLIAGWTVYYAIWRMSWK